MEGLGTGESVITVHRQHKSVQNNLPFLLTSVIMFFLVADITVICPWEAYSHLELHELAQYGII